MITESIPDSSHPHLQEGMRHFVDTLRIHSQSLTILRRKVFDTFHRDETESLA